MKKIKIPLTEMKFVAGSRQVVKSIDGEIEEGKNHYYDSDVWTHWGEKIKDAVPEGFLVYGEIIGWTPDGKAIQPNYTYNLDNGVSELYIYRVAVVTGQGRVVDLTWPQVKLFAEEAGLKTVPELSRTIKSHFVPEEWIDIRFADNEAKFAETHPDYYDNRGTADSPVRLSDKKTVDEGVCVRYDGPSGPYILKAKSPIFLAHETAELDKGIVDTESEESA